jgi:cell division transport system permease protein
MARALRAEWRVILRDALGGIRRNALMTAAATSTIVVALAVAGCGLLVSANLNQLAAMLEEQVEVVAFLRDGLSATQQQDLLSKITASPGVRSAKIVGRSAALGRLQRAFGTSASVTDLLPTNPLPDSIEVRVTDAARTRAVATAIQQTSGVEEVVFGAPVVERLVAATRAVRLGGGVAAALLAAAALLIIVNTIRLTVVARRQEIEIMTLVGATRGFIRWPFLIEGALQGAAGALVTTVVLIAGYVFLVTRVAASLPFLPMLPPLSILPAAVAIVWVVGITVGVCGSEIGLRRYLTA